MKKIEWKREPKGPGPSAFHKFVDAGDERVELLAYDVPASKSHSRLCGFEIFGRSRGGGPFHEQLASGEAESLADAMTAAEQMAAMPRDEWTKLPR